MKRQIQPLFIATALSAGIAACSSSNNSNNNNNQNDASTIDSVLNALAISCVEQISPTKDSGKTQLSLSVVDTYVSGNEFATASAEIVSYDSCSDKLYAVNAENQTVDILNLDPTTSAPSKASTIDLSKAAEDAGIAIGDANSVVAKRGLIAVAIEADNKQEDGIIALYRSDDLSLLATYTAGALPDMVGMTDDARFILTANEGEPNGSYSVDPEGSVTIVDLASGIDSAKVTQVSFAEFNTGATRATELPSDVRITGPAGTTVAQDLEPEYLTVMTTTNKAIVAMQENNAIAIVDIASGNVDGIKGLGVKSWGDTAELDVTNKDGVYSTKTYEKLVGYYMPDTITSVVIDGEEYFLSANEGDGREYIYETTQETCDANSHEWDGDDYSGTADYSIEEDDCIAYIDEGRGDDLDVHENHPLRNGGNDITDGDALGRIKVVMDNPTVGVDDNVYTYGARSFSIWKSDGELLWDSGDDLSKKAHTANNAYWNTTNDNNDSNDDRSDDKGIEPEAIEVAQINGQTFAFVGLERHGGIMVYNISTPSAPVFVQYLNNRDFSVGVCTEVDDGDCDNDTYNTAAGDLGPESIDYFTRGGKHYIAVGNEVSGTTTVYAITMSSEIK
jgi:hypothetical protein